MAKKNHVLYLASESKGRQHLLDLAKIPYKTISHKSDECGIDLTLSFNDYVLAIAKHKMEHVVLDATIKEDVIFVLTADTLIRTAHTKEILGKPKDRDDAKRMLALHCKEPIELVTACCLEKKERTQNAVFKTTQAEHWVTTAFLEFCVEEEYVDEYLAMMPHALNACGAGVLKDPSGKHDYGLAFLKSIHGSFTAVIGLPLFELRQALKKLGFNANFG